MKEEIKSSLDSPAELERLYRKNKSAFQQNFTELYSQIQGQPAAEFWHERLNYESDSVSWGTTSEWRFVIVAGLIAGFLAKFPAIFSIEEEFFYPRNMGFIGISFVTAYFVWKNRLSGKKLGWIAGMTAVAMIYINFLPDDPNSDTLTLASMHLPLLLWAVLGFSFVEGKMDFLPGRLEFLRFNGDAVIMGAVLFLSGLLLSGITIGLFDLIGIKIGEFYMEWIAVFGLAAAPLIASHLTQTNPQLVNKVPPIIAKIFSPLVLVMLLIYLGAIVYSGKDPYNDREFLLLFNMLLIGVIALIFFSVAESSEQGKIDWSTRILAALSLVTVIVNLIALSAIVFRIAEWGFTPNRTAVLGINILMLVHLILVSRNLLSTVRGKTKLGEVGIIIVRYLPVYFIWTAIVIFIFPFLFGFD
ncbi:DUF4153 domain-containing protein [Algoriphagus mannitolivorans]|uniref:DUF4153 domain-containing protein n=1 Tax=Algoriphagus mannitolivorans TaxID=226504 RepID=UPI00040938D2|nr:DUF4153 domain-containing protein [Algoriphagus mannitolivorans]